jgi:hypothetical protein
MDVVECRDQTASSPATNKNKSAIAFPLAPAELFLLAKQVGMSGCTKGAPKIVPQE